MDPVAVLDADDLSWLIRVAAQRVVVRDSRDAYGETD